MSARRTALVLLVLMVVLAGCTTGIRVPAAGPGAAEPVAKEVADDDAIVVGGESPSTDTADRIGWEGGYAHDDPIPLNTTDGVSDAELEAYVARSMARVELLRGHEFTRPVRLEVQTRDALRAQVERTGSFASNETLPPDRVRIMNVFWEALFFVGEDRDVRDVRATEGASFLGAYYAFGSDRIRIVAPADEPPLIDERLLVHELVHALQDEYAGTPLETRTDDDNYATAALVEGDAIYVTRRFADRCASGEWECVDVPPRGDGGGGGSGDVHRGFRTLRQFAYSDGPAFIDAIYTNGRAGRTGWAAVDATFEERPRTTTEIIHPETYPSPTPDRPGQSVRPQGGWQHLGGPYTVGEAGIFGMFQYQHDGYGIEVIDADAFDQPDGGPHDRFNFTSIPSAGWDGDRLDVVANGRETGYVWVMRWDTQRDADEFAKAYRETLAGHGATRVDEGVWVIADGPYADAFAVIQRGRTVTIVNGPTRADLQAIHPPIVREEGG